MSAKKGLNLLNLISVAILILGVAGTLPAEETAETADDTDPSKLVFLSLREEYYNLDGGGWSNRIIYRSDRAILKKTNFAKRTAGWTHLFSREKLVLG